MKGESQQTRWSKTVGWTGKTKQRILNMFDPTPTVSEQVAEESQLLHEYLYRIGLESRECWNVAHTYRHSDEKQRENMLQTFGFSDIEALREQLQKTPPRFRYTVWHAESKR